MPLQEVSVKDFMKLVRQANDVGLAFNLSSPAGIGIDFTKAIKYALAERLVYYFKGDEESQPGYIATEER